MRRNLSANIAKIDSPAIYGTGLTDLALSALYAGGFMLLLSGSLSIAIYAIWGVPILTLIFVSVSLSLFSAGLLGFVRMLAVERDDHIEKQERARRRAREDSDFDFSNSLASDRRMGREPNASRQDQVARNIMRRYYASRSISRKACTEAGICTFAEWNKANDLLKRRGIRVGRLLRPENYPRALEAWYLGEQTARRFRFVNGEPVARE